MITLATTGTVYFRPDPDGPLLDHTVRFGPGGAFVIDRNDAQPILDYVRDHVRTAFPAVADIPIAFAAIPDGAPMPDGWEVRP